MTPGETPRMAGWLESAWLARYLDRQLEGEELAWFEAYLLDKPELLGMVEVDTKLRDALALASVRSSTSDSNGGAPPRTALRQVSASFAIAASLVLGIGVGWLAKPGNPLGRQGMIADPTRVVFDTMRGEATEPHLEHRSSASPWVLIEVAVPASATNVVVTLPGQSAQELELSEDGFVSFLVSRASFASTKTAQVSYLEAGQPRTRTIRIDAVRSNP